MAESHLKGIADFNLEHLAESVAWYNLMYVKMIRSGPMVMNSPHPPQLK
jgi:hypothetical protein